MAVFYNAAADIYIQLWLRLCWSFEYCLGPGMPCREVGYDLSTKNSSLLAEGPNLLSQLKSSKGATAHQISFCGNWSFEKVESTVEFTIKGRSTEKLVLMDDGFIYFCATGALVGRRDSEAVTSIAIAIDVLGKKRVSNSAVPRPSPKVLGSDIFLSDFFSPISVSI